MNGKKARDHRGWLLDLTSAIYGRRAGLDVLLIERCSRRSGKYYCRDRELARSGPCLWQELGDMFSACRSSIQNFVTLMLRKLSFAAAKVVVTDKGEIEAEAIILATEETWL